MMTRTDWDQRFMDLARFVGSWSKDRTTKVGCVIVGPNNDIRSIGYNGFPQDICDDIEERHEKPLKYRWTEHAERNAIYSAARAGTALYGCKMYLPWFPCMDCARAIVQAGVSEVFAIQPDLSHPTWGDEFRHAAELLRKADVKMHLFDQV